MTQSLSLNRSGRWSGPLFMITAGALFAGSNTAVQAAGMTYGAPAPAIAFWQYAIATAFAVPLFIAASWRTERLGWHVLRVLFAVLGVQAWVAGLATVPIWQAIALLLLSPIFVSLGAGMFLNERLSVGRVLAVLAGAVGGGIILAPWSDSFQIQALLPVLAAGLWAGSSLVTKYLSDTESTQVLTLYLLALLLPFNAVAALGSGFALQSEVIWVVALAGLFTVAAQFCLAKAYALADAAYLQPFDHLKLPINVALGLVVFGFAPPGSMWLGALIIAASGAWLMSRDS